MKTCKVCKKKMDDSEFYEKRAVCKKCFTKHSVSTTKSLKDEIKELKERLERLEKTTSEEVDQLKRKLERTNNVMSSLLKILDENNLISIDQLQRFMNKMENNSCDNQ